MAEPPDGWDGTSAEMPALGSTAPGGSEDVAGRVLKEYDQYDHTESSGTMASWKVAEAKARFSELIDRALREGAQEVTRHGKRAVVVVAAEEWDRRRRRTGSLVEFLDRSPLKGSGLEIPRLRDQPPDVEL